VGILTRGRVHFLYSCKENEAKARQIKSWRPGPSVYKKRAAAELA